MRKLIVFCGLCALVMSSCGLKGSGEVVKGPQLLTVEFVGPQDSVLQNSKGKVKLFAVPANVADVSATMIDEVDFEAAQVPFTVDFEIPMDHLTLIKPEVQEGDSIKYYVSMDWDSNADGQIDSMDMSIDFDRQFPDIDINQLHQQVFLK